MTKQMREDVVKALMNAAQNAVGRDFTDEEKGDFRKQLAWKLEPLCDGDALFPYMDSYGGVSRKFSVDTQAGKLVASSCGCESDGIALTLVPDGMETEIDLAYAEVKHKELCEGVSDCFPTSSATPDDVCVYTYDNPYSEDYQHSFVIRKRDVKEALKDA